MDPPPLDLTKEFIVLGKGDVVIPIKDNPKITSVRLRDVLYYTTATAVPRNIICLKMLQQDYPKLMLGTMEIDKLHGTGIVHVDEPERVVLEVDRFPGTC